MKKNNLPFKINHLKFALVGATGLVGEKLLKILEERSIYPEKLFLYASEKSSDKEIFFNGKAYPVIPLSEAFLDDDWNVLFFSAGKNIAFEFASMAVEKADLIIDNSPAFRMDDDIPLIVPQVNGTLLDGYSGIVANPNCTTIQLVVALGLLKKIGLRSVVVSTYQAVSGAGKKRLDYLISNGKSGEPFEYEINRNVIPKIGELTDDEYFTEEEKIIKESKKILSKSELNITATCVRVPVPYSHSESVMVEFERETSKDEIINELSKCPVIKIADNNEIFTPIDCVDDDVIYISRIRRAFSNNKFWNFFIVSDNLRRGAATNAVDIFERWLKGKKGKE